MAWLERFQVNPDHKAGTQSRPPFKGGRTVKSAAGSRFEVSWKAQDPSATSLMVVMLVATAVMLIAAAVMLVAPAVMLIAAAVMLVAPAVMLVAPP